MKLSIELVLSMTVAFALAMGLRRDRRPLLRHPLRRQQVIAG
ncbi:MAG: hypothetical protein QF570_03055 [Myxococcota bacterium]|nr:hypothetical protein [Myxococcota bacterium]